MAQMSDEMPLIDFSDETTSSMLPTFAALIDLSDLTPGPSDSDGSVSTDGEDAAASTAPSIETLKQEARKRALSGYIHEEHQREETEFAAMLSAPRYDDFKPEQQQMIEKAREYQQELFERAKEENIIAVLDTGSGKTLIACLLIRHILEREQLRRAAGGSHKVVFFLANSVHLVKQQGKVLANNLLDAPRVLSGKNDLGKRDVWAEILEHNTVVVCPPAILDACLAHAYLKMSDISLLIFDEAHHAKKDHPYSRLIRSFYMKCPPHQRPRIFGMTASPVDSKRSIEKATQDLEEVLHAKVVTTDDLSILSFAPKPTNEKWVYDILRPGFETDLFHEIWILANFSSDLKRFFDFAKQATSELGLWCADRVWKYATGQTTSGIQRRYEQSQAYQELASVDERQHRLQALTDAVSLINSRLVVVPALEPSYLSSKVLLLHARLSGIYNKCPTTRAIVFVNARLKALLLRDVFEQIPIANLRVGVLLGIAAGNNEGTSVKDQEKILEHFRAGLINLVFATSVADEGLDIPQCNLCVRFDLCTTTIQYMQSRGRARMHGSIFAHMIEDNNFGHLKNLEYQMDEEQYLKQWCAALPADRKLGKGTSLIKMLAQDTTIRGFRTSSGAVCDASNCLLILSQFAASLAHVGATDKEIYEEEIDSEKNLFRYAVRLPKSENLAFRGCHGEWKPNKQLAKRSAAWSCCLRLRQKRELNEDLDSIHRKFKPANANARLAVTAKQSSYDMQVKPALWDMGLGCIPSRLFAAITRFIPRGHLKTKLANIVLFTRERLPRFPVFAAYLEEGVTVDIEIEGLDQSFFVGNAQLDWLTCFTLNGVFADVFNKVHEHDPANMSYWLAPMARQTLHNVTSIDDLVDFEDLSACEQERVAWSSNMPHETWTNKFLCDPLNGKFHYFTGAVVPGASIHDRVRADMPYVPQKRRTNIIDFSDSHWTASKKRKGAEGQYDEHQPVLEAELVGTRRNFLQSDTMNNLIPCRIAPQTLQIARIGTTVAASCLVWPAIIHRLESYLIALEAFEKLELPGISSELALEALTKDAENEEEQELHTSGKRGMGKNYERLEFIGDSLLKMTTTIAVFCRTNYNEEGMHCRRMEILCNRRLYDVATGTLMLYKYARSQPFNRITWYPENIKLISGRGAKNPPEPVKHGNAQQDLGMKTIADMSEAIIGAAVLTSQQKSGDLDLGIQAITKLVQSEDHEVNKWADFAQIYTSPEWSLSKDDILANELAETIRSKTGYTFQHPRLGRSAFTHSSDVNSPVPDLQRLEFLGDAVLDWVCISWLFNNNPNKNPQWLTEHKMAMVSNKFLAALAVTLDFDKLIFTSTVQLLIDIESYATKVRDARAAPDCKPSFWTEIERPPKALADLVESYLGALLIDSNFDYSRIEAFFEKHIKQFFLNIEDYDSFANRHPTTFLFKKLQQEFRCRDYSILDSEPAEGKIEVEITAGVIVHNKVLATDKGPSAKYARVRACKKVIAAMDGMTREQFRQTFGCNCQSRED